MIVGDNGWSWVIVVGGLWSWVIVHHFLDDCGWLCVVMGDCG